MDSIEKIDYFILEFIRTKIKNPIMDKIMVYITRLGDLDALWIGIALIFLNVDNYHENGITIIVSLILCGIIGNLILKNLFTRTRPYDVKDAITLLISKPKDYSFPSCHTMASVAAAYVIFNVDYRLGIISWIIALLIAFSRMYLYVHYPSDVVAGAVIGILIGAFSIYIMNLEFIEKIMIRSLV